MRHSLRLAGQTHLAALTGGGKLLLDDSCVEAAVAQGRGSAATVTINGLNAAIHIAGTDDCWFIWHDGDTYEVRVLEPLAVHARVAHAAGGLHARAPMPGNVVAVPVSVGDRVDAQATLVIIESMKLEVSIRAAQAGTVAEIRCAVGVSFDKDAVLVVLAE